MAVPPVFVSGQVLTAAQMNAVGLWLVKSQTVGSGVSTVTVTDAFSADYRNYYITYTGGVLSGVNLLGLYLGASTGTAYYFARTGANVAGTVSAAAGNNDSKFTYAGAGNTSSVTLGLFLYGPQVADRTYLASDYWEPNGGSSYFGRTVGFLDNTTQYTSFTLSPGAGTMTGGTIKVYGIRD